MIGWIKRLVHGCDRPEPSASEAALEWTRTARQAAEARRPAVRAAVAPIRRALEENHLAERIEELFKGATR